jgi:REP element-mobilizing transposase RayT
MSLLNQTMPLTRRRRPRQLELALPERPPRGGKRPGAGRKPRPDRKGFVPHVQRPTHSHAHPSHVTLRVVATMPSLREEILFAIIRRELSAASRGAFRLTAFSVQHDHIHLVVEAADRARLARGIQRFASRVARRLNFATYRVGKVFRDRYHRRDLRTPREVRNAYVYVLMNRRKHADAQHKARALAGLDPCSSLLWFAGLSCRDGPERLHRALDALGRANAPFASKTPPVVRSGTWLGRVGWRRHGLIDLAERPRDA